LATSDSLTFLIVAPDLVHQTVQQILDIIRITRSFQSEEALFNHITSSLAARVYAFPHFHNRSRSESRDIVLNATVKRVRQEKMCLFKQFAEPTNNATSVIDFSAIDTAPAISAYNTASAAFSAIDVAPAVPAHNKASVTASSAINAAPAVPAHNKASAAAVPLSTASLLDIYGVHEDFFEADDADALGETEGEAHNQISIKQAGRKRIASTVSTSTSKARKLKHTVGLNRLQQTTITFAPLSKQTPVANLAGELLDSYDAPLSSRLRSQTTVSSTDTTPSVVQQVANTLSSPSMHNEHMPLVGRSTLHKIRANIDKIGYVANPDGKTVLIRSFLEAPGLRTLQERTAEIKKKFPAVQRQISKCIGHHDCK
jgi:hypothetical protein